MGITAHLSVDEFFREELVGALERLQVDATAHTEFYLVGLLGEFTKARIPDEPLSVMLAQTEAASPQARMRVLKEVGDTSLYVTGFFADSFGRRLVDPDYYIGLGEAAYAELAHRLEPARGAAEVYEELASKFPRFVDVLHQIRDRVSFAGSNVVKLYEQWLKTRSDWVERRMRALGLIVAEPETVH